MLRLLAVCTLTAFSSAASHAGDVDCPLEFESPVEQWVWTQICNGRPADLLEFEGIEPKKISSRFITNIIDRKDLTDQIGRAGLHIKNATVTGSLDITNAKIAFPLLFEKCTFLELVKLDSVSTSYDITFNEPMIFGSLSLRSLHSSASVYVGNLNLKDLRFPLAPKSQSLISNVDLSDADVAGRIMFGNVRVNGTVILQNTRSGAISFGRCWAQHLGLSQSITKGQLAIVDCIIEPPDKSIPSEALNLYSAHAGSLHLNRSTFKGTVYATSMSLLGFLQARSATFSSLVLVGASIGGVIDFGSSNEKQKTAATWQAPAFLNMRRAKAAGVILSGDSKFWPKEIDFDGLAYNYIGPQIDNAASVERAPASWYIHLLALHGSDSTQPYEQLARVLKDNGRSVDSNRVLYAGRDRQMKAIWDEGQWLHAAWYFLFKIFIGYGYRLWLAMFWAAGFVVLGAVIFRRTPEAKAERMPFGLSFSFDRLLPLVKLRERHYKIDLAGWPRYYFYLHQIMGYILGSFLIAGLSGLTK